MPVLTNDSYLASSDCVFCLLVLWRNNRATSSLNHRLHHLRPIFDLDLDPLICVHVEHNHVLSNHAVLGLAAVDNHATLIANGGVIFARSDAHTFGLANLDGALLEVILKHLVCALSDLSFAVELEAAPENVQLVVVSDGTVALASLYKFLGRERRSFPDHLFAHDSALDDFPNRFTIHAANHVSIEA